MRLAIATALMLAGAAPLAARSAPPKARIPEERVYVLHSKAVGSCPSLDWHIVSEPGGTLSGMIAWDNMQAMAKATGTVDRNNRTFSVIATELGGQGRRAAIDGTIRSDGWLVANIRGEQMNCSAVVVPIYAEPPDTDKR
jgi:hypothetical protein